MTDDAGHRNILSSPVAVAIYAFLVTTAFLSAPLGTDYLPYGAGQVILAGFLVVLGVWMLSDLDYAARAVASNAVVFTIPLLALISVVWSDHPDKSLSGALQLIPTLLAALMLGAARRVDIALIGVFAAYFIHLVLSLAFGQSNQIGVHGPVAFTGLFYGKNFFGGIAAFGYLLSLPMIGYGLIRKNRLLLLSGAIGLVMAVACVVISRASGSLISAAVATAAFVAVLIMGRAKPSERVLTLIVIALVVTPIILELETIRTTIEQVVLKTFNKDPGLTGRAYIWKRADVMIATRPWLGVGYNAFWVKGSANAEELWAANFIVTRTGFNFHNQGRELLVHLGWIGLTAVVASVLLMVGNLVRRIFTAPTLADAFWMAILLYMVARMPVESLGPSPFAMDTLLFFAALSGPAARFVPNWNQAPEVRRSTRADYRNVVAVAGRDPRRHALGPNG